MKTTMGIGLLAILAIPAPAVADTKDDVKAAAKKLSEAANYSWTATPTAAPEGGGGQGRRFQPCPSEGKAEKDGLTWMSSKSGDQAYEAVMKGSKAAIKTADGWKGPADFPAPGQGATRDPMAMVARSLATFKSPAATIESLADKATDLKAEGDVISGGLSPEGVQELIGRAGRGGQNAPALADAKGTVAFTLKDGLVSKLEWKASGKMTFGQRETTIDRGMTIEIKDVGSTKVEIPEDAKKKLE